MRGKFRVLFRVTEKKSVRDIRAYKVEDWSDFTQIVKES